MAPQAGPLTVRLRTLHKPSAPGTISLTQLRHPPSRKAFQAVASAQRFSQSGQTEKAVEELEKAIRISPEYADAYNNLAVQHMRMGRFEEAAGELTHAISIAGPNPMALSNLAYAQRQLNRIRGRHRHRSRRASSGFRFSAGAPDSGIDPCSGSADARAKASRIWNKRRRLCPRPAPRSEQVRARASVDFSHDVLIHEAPDPTLARLNGPGEGMFSAVKMFGRVFVFRGIAAAHVAALHTQAQVYPRVAALEAFLTSALVRRAYLESDRDANKPFSSCSSMCHGLGFQRGDPISRAARLPRRCFAENRAGYRGAIRIGARHRTSG